MRLIRVFNNKKRILDSDDDEEAFHEQVRRLHAHSEEIVQKAMEKVAGLQIDVERSILKSVHAYDSSRRKFISLHKANFK